MARDPPQPRRDPPIPRLRRQRRVTGRRPLPVLRVSVLGWGLPEAEETAARRLLLQVPLEPELDGRVALYGCEICSDIYCGATTVLIERQGDEFVWRDVALSSPDYEAEGFTFWHDRA